MRHAQNPGNRVSWTRWMALWLVSIPSSIAQTTGSKLPPSSFRNSSSIQLFLQRDVVFDLHMTAQKLVQDLRNDPSKQLLLLSTEKDHDLDDFVRYAGDERSVVLGLTGYKGGELSSQTNQDRGLIMRIEDQITLLGVFDGHGARGHFVSQFVQDQIPMRMHDQLTTLLSSNKEEDTDSVVAILTTMVEQIDQSVPEIDAMDGGATATMVMRLGRDRVVFCNTGDSRSAIGAHLRGLHVLLRESKLHVPDDPQEKDRIHNAGGLVKDWNGIARATYVDIQGRSFGLAMSRSVGDWSVTGVIASPDVHVFRTDDLAREALDRLKEVCAKADETMSLQCDDTATSEDVQLFAVAVSDGISDYLTSEELIQAAGDTFYRGNATHPFVAANDVILTAAGKWYDKYQGRYRDDITIAMAQL